MPSSRGLDWKWIGFGVLIMFGLSFVAGWIMAFIWGDELTGAVQSGEAVEALGGMAVWLLLISIASFVIGGYIVGVKSSRRTILEPAISAAIAVAIGLLLTGSFTLGSLFAGALVPFLAALLGGWLGERHQDRRTAPKVQ